MTKQIVIKKCLRCKYNWSSRVKDPKECPLCKSRTWMVKE